MKKTQRIFVPLTTLVLANAPLSSFAESNKAEAEIPEEHVRVWGRVTEESSRQPSPVVELTPADFTSINANTLEDLVKYEPSLIIRRRYIGDSNGTVGMRGSNMFQTPRTMVFVDGVPIHYHLQTRWSGAPRWSMVAPNEVGKIDIVYGPFSAEYSGNAMAGVINVETIIPQQQEVHAEFSAFQQDFDAYGFDDQLPGYRGFLSYGNYWNGFSVYLSYNRLENESQPQTFRLNPPLASAPSNAIPVSGAVTGENEYGDQNFYFGDTGSEKTQSDYTKLKLGYESGNWMSLLNIVYEQRETDARSSNNYLRDAQGEPVWQGPVSQNGTAFDVSPTNFSTALTERESIIVGGRVKGDLDNGWGIEFNGSVFESLKDQTREWPINPQDPTYSGASSLSEFDELAWQTAEMKARKTFELDQSSLHLLTGYTRYQYQLEVDEVSGGETLLDGLFTQFSWESNSAWSSTVGLRYERWQSNNGFFGEEQHADRQDNAVSPKFSLTYTTPSNNYIRYSYAQAYRFPIVEELFQNQESARQESIANIDLDPEFGHHHNLMFNKELSDGYMRINLFYEVIEDAIDAQSKVIDNISVRTFLPIDEVETSGVELAYVQKNVAALPLDIRANVTYAKSEITENAGGEQNYVGKDFPRMPHWRANLLATYHLNAVWDIGGGLRHASNSYGDADNGDNASDVFGAMDDYTFYNLKTRYKLSDHMSVSAGVDNIFNKIAYVHHPWPGRTFYLETSLSF